MSVAAIQHRAKSSRLVLFAAASAAFLGAMLPVGTGPAFAADDQYEDTWDTKFMYGILRGLGLRDGTEPGIDYHERSPLVVPPTRDLPPPGTTAAAAAANPAWPKDPDLAKQRAAVKRTYRNTVAAEEEDMRQLRPDELKQRGSGIGRKTADSGSKANTTGSTREEQMTPSQLGFGGFKWNPASWFDREGTVIPFVKEPERTTLTEPPPGLRTPSASYQYGSKGKLEPVRNNEVDQAVGAKNQ